MTGRADPAGVGDVSGNHNIRDFNDGNNPTDTHQPASSSLADELPTREGSSRIPRRWTKEEDQRLRLLVSFYGDQSGKQGHWEEIRSKFDNRTAKDCRKRWFHSLDPKLKRGRWSTHEDKTLMEAYEELGPAWQRIAKLIPGRTDDQCSKRYNDALDPNVQDRLRPWTAEEDAKLNELQEKFGSKWQKISQELVGRTGLTCRNRWRKLNREAGGSYRETSMDPSLAAGAMINGISPYGDAGSNGDNGDNVANGPGLSNGIAVSSNDMISPGTSRLNGIPSGSGINGASSANGISLRNNTYGNVHEKESGLSLRPIHSHRMSHSVGSITLAPGSAGSASSAGSVGSSGSAGSVGLAVSAGPAGSGHLPSIGSIHPPPRHGESVSNVSNVSNVSPMPQLRGQMAGPSSFRQPHIPYSFGSSAQVPAVPTAANTTAPIPSPASLSAHTSPGTFSQPDSGVYARPVGNSDRVSYTATLESSEGPLKSNGPHYSLTQLDLDRLFALASQHNQQVIIHQHIYTSGLSEPNVSSAARTEPSTEGSIDPLQVESESNSTNLQYHPHVHQDSSNQYSTEQNQHQNQNQNQNQAEAPDELLASSLFIDMERQAQRMGQFDAHQMGLHQLPLFVDADPSDFLAFNPS